MIPYGRESINQEDIDAVIATMHSIWLTQGPEVPAFEADVENRCQAKYAVATSSATAALHIACLALGVGIGDHVWTSPNTFIASASCALYCGATVDFVDIDPQTLNMSVSALAEKLAHARATHCLPKVIIPVHFSGQPCDMEGISQLAKEYGCRVIEDAAHAIGATYQGTPVGNCAYSDITVFSFHPVKIITTGEGGMALTNDEGLARRLARLRSHGIARDSSEMQKESEGPWYYQQVELGFNYRITDIQAALGRSQLRRLDGFLAARRALASRYDAILPSLPITLPVRAPNRESSWHLYPIQVASERRREIFEAMRAADIIVQVHYIPVHLHPYYLNRGFQLGDFPNAEAYYQRAFSLPLYPDLSEEQQDTAIAVLTNALA